MPIHLIYHSLVVAKVLIEDHHALSEDAAPPCGLRWHSTPFQMDVTQSNELNSERIKQTHKENKARSFKRPCGQLSEPPGLCDLTTLHRHKASAERILSSWLMLK